ncbi:hypothetical protein EPUS_01900 [Endocarpon pusillum Z07020]|uniref:Histone deacetylase domain-containing protein n=1 Tax=Endocarpon pusillum (strain Z07020 / HMAS-L-300199) TaxID=1263415 RepID=U1HHD4_ENDPU|nr:uncharacterized protein EPUS_01900 [Endocarpon pusillum Z07020]ERF69570.1 hypothetical protein EPUS_01900 [Endocarpon pusillum Z07020]
MGYDDPVPSIERETLPNRQLYQASTNNKAASQWSQEPASLNSASNTPLPPSSPATIAQLAPRLHMHESTPGVQSLIQKRSTSHPLNHDRRSSTPLQLNRRVSAVLSMTSSSTPTRPPTSRRVSSNLLLPSSASSARSRSSSGATIRDMERKPETTSSSVAQDYFRRELGAHASAETSSKAAVIIRDACYGHRYSRPRTSKAALSTIVERPERLHACILGASTAYVRMGGRHAGGDCPPHPDHDVSSPPFKIQKTTRSIPLNYAAVTQVHGQKWMEELQIMCDSAEGKLAMNGRELVRPIGYGKDEAGDALPKLHEGDLYLCSASLDALQGCLGGVCEAVDAVCGPGNTSRAFVCIRPPGHHCSSNFPSGFCWLNNVHVGIAHAAMTQGLTHAAIIDFDLHHGDGSQAIAWDHNRKAAGNLPKNASPYSRTPIGYFSLHDINSYPCEWGDEEKIKNASLCVENAHGQSVWNVHLEPWKNHTDFWKLYRSRYCILLEKTRIFLRQHTTRLQSASNGPKAKAAIFLSAGFDASEWEGAGMQRHKVNVPTDFYARFTSDVVKLAEEEGLGVDGRIISVLEGGYSDRALTSGVLSHLCGLTHDIQNAISKAETIDTGLASAMAKQMSMPTEPSLTPQTDGKIHADGPDTIGKPSYNPEWWSTFHLEALEVLVNPPAAPSSQTKSKDKTIGNYSSPTQASTAKMADPARERRSLSVQAEGRASIEPEPVQPPPDVDWAVASYELSRLLIPTDRQTLSCRHDELNAEATKVRRERQSTIGLPSDDPSVVDQKMQLRDRKAKAIVGEDPLKAASKADRRRTIAAVGDLPDPGALQDVRNKPAIGIANNRARRRSSAGSSMLSAFENMSMSDRDSQAPESGVSTTRRETVLEKVPVQRKVKQPAAAKVQPSKPRTSPRKTGPTPPVPKVPSAFSRSSSHTSTERRETTTNQTRSARGSVASADTLTKVDDLDALSSHMTKLKINLKVPSAEDNAARERKGAVEKDKQRKSRVPRKPPVAKAAKDAPTKPRRQSDAPHVIPSSTSETITTNKQTARVVDVPASTAQRGQQPLPVQNRQQPASADQYVPTANIADIAHAEPPLQATIPAPVPAPVEIDTAVLTQNATKDSEDASLGTPWKEALQTLALSTTPVISSPALPPHPLDSAPSQQTLSAPSASAPTTIKKTRPDLPQFTASSPIPFPKMDLGVRPLQPAKEEGKPSHHQHPVESHPHLQHQTKESTAPVAETKSALQQLPKAAADASMWEVPETPRR